MSRLNYHHLHYFWRVATVGNLTRVAQELHVSQSALSSQIRQLEESMGQPLFDRNGRNLRLTEWGQRVLTYAQDIFSKGEELASLVQRGTAPEVQVIRVGVLSTMSRNFVDAFLTPLLPDPSVRLVLQSQGIAELLDSLASHTLDVVLSNINVTVNPKRIWQSQVLARQPVSVVGPAGKKPRGRFPKGYESMRWILPRPPSEIRAGFDAFCSSHQFEPDIQAEVDDMAMLRLLARDSGALAILPRVVVRDEIRRLELSEYMALPTVTENFYAITVQRSYQPPALRELLKQRQSFL
ncbi:MAG: LysR family transcriptional regulator [Alcanivoracaceae bacterium]|nr:LysR family transcriptional regulator [Alcanivoracaceae bacterium]